MNPLPQLWTDAPHNGTDTSRDAAHAIRKHLPAIESRVLVHLSGMANGATNDELEVVLGLIGSTVRPRIVELRDRGLVRDSGKRRPTRTGRNAIVWEVVK